MELLSYIQFAFIGYFISVSIRNKHCSNILLLASFFIYSSVSRYSGFDVDILEYSYAMHSDKMTIYYLKEPVFWLGSRFFFSVFQSEEAVFILYDMFCFFMVLKSLELVKQPKYIAVFMFIFFPSVMGLQNVYRQFIAVSFLLSSILLCNSKPKSSWLMFCFAVLSQNSAAIFLPLLLHFKSKKYLSYISSIFVLALLPIAIGTKSTSDTGTLGPEVYIIALSFLFVFSFLLVYFSREKRYYFILFPYAYLFLLVTEAMLLMGTGQSKRVGMMSLLLYLLVFVGLIEKIKNIKHGFRFVLFFVCVLPTFIFSSTMQFFQ
ncbi:TPA: hypothetical protein I7135_18210 [Vibrio vulnificus]|nr:hypothetical protein [Vibrio vulnificus]